MNNSSSETYPSGRTSLTSSAPLVSRLRCIGLTRWCGVELANNIKRTLPFTERVGSAGSARGWDSLTGAVSATAPSIIDEAAGEVQKQRGALSM